MKDFIVVNPIELRNALRAEPFIPLTIHLTDGRSFELRHPEMAIMANFAVYLVMDNDPQTGIPERVEYISIQHISGFTKVGRAAAQTT